MWGNVWGWFLSLLIVLGTVVGLVYLERMDRAASPTALAKDDKNLAVLELPPQASIDRLLPDLTGPQDPRELYRRAIAAYMDDPAPYDTVARGGELPRKFGDLPAIAPLLDAALSPSDVVLAPMSDDVVTLVAARRPLEAISTLGEALVRAGLALEETNRVTAIGYYNVALSLGYKLYRERLVYDELVAGMTLMSEAALRLAKLTTDDQRRDTLLQFENARRQFVIQRITPIRNVIAAADPNIMSLHAGDVIVFARTSKERLWRVEAAFALARHKYSAPRPRDRAAALRTLEALAADEKDPIVRRAATLARDLTVEENRTLR